MAEAKGLRAVMRKPSGTRSAVPRLSSQSFPPVLISTICSAATRRSNGTTGASMCFQVQTVRATVCVCIDSASAVEPQ